MTIVVSGASGDLGARVTRLLLDRIPANELILLTRTPDKLADAAALGAEVRQADFDDTANLADALAGGDVLLLISTLSIGKRAQQHNNAIEAARTTGVRHIVYTSSVGIQPQTPSLSGQEHYQSEQLLIKSGLKYTILRNGWYADVIPMLMMKPSIEAGAFVASTGDGSVAMVAKADCANAAACVLADAENHEGAVYEITGPALLTFADIARLCSDAAGKPTPYVNVSHEEKLAIFDAMGVNREYEEGMMNDTTNAWASNEMITYEMAIKQLYFAVCSRHVELITGHPATPLQEVIEQYRAVWA